MLRVSSRFLIVLAILQGALSMTSVPEVMAQRIVAHRGASFDAPENTLAAFEMAWKQGADGIEGDFYLTADGEIVCIHDPTTRRTSNESLVVSESSLSELRRLEVGSWKGGHWAKERIPTFEEVLRTVPSGKLFVIELKSKVEIVEPLKRQLDKLGHDEIKILIISFDEATIQKCKEWMPEVRAHWLTSFERVDDGDGFRPSAEAIAATVRRCGADGVGMQGNRDVIVVDFVESLRRDGCHEFHVWTVDSPVDAEYFARLGAGGITTNRPALIRQALEP